jgi:hypothetical protein
MSGGGRSRRRKRYRGPTYRGTADEGRRIADEESYGITGSIVHTLEVSEVSGAAATAEVDVGFEDNTGSPRFLIS